MFLRLRFPPCLFQRRSLSTLIARSSNFTSASKDLDSSKANVLPIRIPTRGVDVLVYTDVKDVEAGALKQLRDVAESGAVVGHVAAMPDVHLGMGATIGSVFASKEYVAPNAVGVDIGCGMGAVLVRGLYKDVRRAMLEQMQTLIKKRIPTGFNWHRRPLDSAEERLADITARHPPSRWLKEKLRADGKVATQLGTLGGGNHFLELVHDEAGRVWIMLHSGSRNIGNITASHYNNAARLQMRQLKELHQSNAELNFLKIESEEGQNYLKDMEWCQRYAFENRALMMEVMQQVVEEVTGCVVDSSEQVNIHHNYCSCERCRIVGKDGSVKDEEVWVTRKGATSARKGELGIIPGSMGTGSYIVMGKGNEESFHSCSHGAGRKMSRTKAYSGVSQAEFERSMEGVVCDVDAGLRDEAPAAYKDIVEVMSNQKDLVDVVHKLSPMLNVKGMGKMKRR